MQIFCLDEYISAMVKLLFMCWIQLMVSVICTWTGRFLAELTKEVFSDLEASKYQVCYLFITCFVSNGTGSYFSNLSRMLCYGF